jgi:predicted NBD/HSP70 family sugar kinase
LWAAGHHFERLYGADGATLAIRAASGDTAARSAFQAIGRSLGQTIVKLLSVLPPIEAAIIGGGVSGSWRFFAPTMRPELRGMDVHLTRTRMHHPALAGAAALFQQAAATPTG